MSRKYVARLHKKIKALKGKAWDLFCRAKNAEHEIEEYRSKMRFVNRYGRMVQYFIPYIEESNIVGFDEISEEYRKKVVNDADTYYALGPCPYCGNRIAVTLETAFKALLEQHPLKCGNCKKDIQTKLVALMSGENTSNPTDKWMPGARAPKDGSLILGIWPNGKYHLARWTTDIPRCHGGMWVLEGFWSQGNTLNGWSPVLFTRVNLHQKSIEELIKEDDEFRRKGGSHKWTWE